MGPNLRCLVFYKRRTFGQTHTEGRHVKTQGRRAIYKMRRDASKETYPGSSLVSYIQDCEKIHFWLSAPSVVLAMVARAVIQCGSSGRRDATRAAAVASWARTGGGPWVGSVWGDAQMAPGDAQRPEAGQGLEPDVPPFLKGLWLCWGGWNLVLIPPYLESSSPGCAPECFHTTWYWFGSPEP